MKLIIFQKNKNQFAMKGKLTTILIILGIILVIVIYILTQSIVTIEPGERGVIFRPWTTGLDTNHIYGEGVHIIAPWNQLYVYDVREQTIDFIGDNALDVLDKNGLTIEVDVTVRFYPKYDKIGQIHAKFGKNYVNKLVIPEVRSAVRSVMGLYTAEEIYSTKRQEVEHRIIELARDKLDKNYIVMTALLIRSIRIPENLRKAIELKLTKQQEALAYDYILEKEQKEKQRKIIQAQGIAEYNKIINASMTDKVLTYEGIQATLELAKSQNAKIIIIGNTKNGLPLVFQQ